MIKNFTQSNIINPAELYSLISKESAAEQNITIIDATFVLPTSPENISENFQNERIPTAKLFNISDVKDKNSDFPHMLPSQSDFENAISQIGVNNSDLIIIYGQHGMIMGPARLWWMLKGFGHKNVLILNGGLPAWKKYNLPTENEKPKSTETSNYKAQPFSADTIISINEMQSESNSKNHIILDARPNDRFTGSSPEPRKGMKSGHIPGSINIPCSSLIKEDGTFKSKEDLKELFKNCDDAIKQNQKILTSCGSGITACALALALSELGHNNTAVYDGSWSEWGLEKNNMPIEQGE